MSTLTKILIVLLTLSAFFLCGIVGLYVATANNYKKLYDNQTTRFHSAEKDKKGAQNRLTETIKATDRQQKKLRDQIASLKREINSLKSNLKDVEREKADLSLRVTSWAAIVKDFSKTTDKQGLLLKNTLDELKNIQAELIDKRKELSDTTAYLEEKMAIIETLYADKRRLLEEKTDLQSKLDRFLRPLGKEPITARPVTPRTGMVRPAMPTARDIALKGRVTGVNLENSMASISLGAADGVKEGMKFYVTRGNEFICEILIIDIDTEEAIGVLQLVQQEKPKIGDSVATNF